MRKFKRIQTFGRFGVPALVFLPSYSMDTRFYRNHYGLNAETEHGNLSFHTMKIYSGEIVTRVSLITERREGVRIMEPTTTPSKAHPRVKRFTFKLLREIHAQQTLELLDVTAAAYPTSRNATARI